MQKPLTSDVPDLRERVVRLTCERYPGKRELVELLALVVCARENLLIVGPPGTAKSEIVSEIARRLGGRYFEYLLTRFTEPSEIFGPVDLARLREGELVTCTRGMLPEAEIVFLDEIFHAGSAILNTLLGILNEGIYRRGSETRTTDIVSVLAATNRLVDDPALGALEDRFTLRIHVDSLPEDRTPDLLRAGWELEKERLRGDAPGPDGAFGMERLREVHRAIADVRLDGVLDPLSRLVARVRKSGTFLSDRRAVKLQRLAAASALLCGRREARASDLWPARYVWEDEEDRELLENLVEDFITAEEAAADGAPAEDHPLASRSEPPAVLLRSLRDLEVEVDRLDEPPATGATDRLHDRIHDLDRRRRWCRARNADDRTRLRELETRLDGLAETLARKEDTE